jgi:hypothetical protein
MIPSPEYLNWEEWAGIVVEDFSNLGLPEIGPWRDWGLALLEFDEFKEVPPPEFFDHWQQWADRVVDVVGEST